VNALLTPEEKLRRVDEAVERVKQSFVDAVEEVTGSDAVASPLGDRLGEVATRLRSLPGALEPSLFDGEQIYEAQIALHEIRDLMAELDEAGDRLDILDQLLIRIELVRHVVRDAIDEHVSGIGDDAGRVVAQIADWTPAISKQEIARLVGVDRKTISRWTEKPGPPQRRQRPCRSERLCPAPCRRNGRSHGRACHRACHSLPAHRIRRCPPGRWRRQ